MRFLSDFHGLSSSAPPGHVISVARPLVSVSVNEKPLQRTTTADPGEGLRFYFQTFFHRFTRTHPNNDKQIGRKEKKDFKQLFFQQRFLREDKRARCCCCCCCSDKTSSSERNYYDYFRWRFYFNSVRNVFTDIRRLFRRKFSAKTNNQYTGVVTVFCDYSTT